MAPRPRAFLAVLLLALSAAAAAQPRVVVIAVPGLTADDLTSPALPTLRRIVSGGAVGWINTRTARVPGQTRDPEEAAWLTLGAGARATAGAYASAPSGAALRRLRTDNAGLDHPVSVGALGDMLHRAALTTHVAGNADDVAPRRLGLLLAMDRGGRVDRDDSEPTGRSRSRLFEPYGLSSDMIDFRFPDERAALAVWVFGDVARADRYARLCLPEAAAKHRFEALRRLDGVLSYDVVGRPMAQTRYMLLAPAPAYTAPDGDRLAPIVVWGAGISAGLLASGSTRVPGLVANTDFLPTVARYLAIPASAGLVGRPMTSVPDRAGSPTPERWAAMHRRWYDLFVRQRALGGLPTLQLLLIVGGTAAAAVGMAARRPGGPSRILAACALAVGALPLAQLVLPAVPVPGTWQAAALLVLSLLAIAGLGARRPGWAGGAILMAAVALVTLLVADLLVGGPLLRGAWLSYSVMDGARYYGIGNEYGGALLAASLFVAATMAANERRSPLLPAALLAAVTLSVGAPALGANAGVALACAVGFALALLAWWRGRIRARDVAFAVTAGALVLAAVAGLDLARGGAEQSHLARALGAGGLWAVADRKLQLNAYLLLHSPWAPVLFAGVAGTAVLCRRGPHWHSGVAGRAAAGLPAGLAAGVVLLLLCNDSGVVAAAQASALGWAWAAARRARAAGQS